MSSFVIDPHTNINSLIGYGGTGEDSLLPGLGLYNNQGYMNVGVDNKAIGINCSNVLYIRPKGITNEMLETPYINLTSSDGITISDPTQDLGGVIELGLDDTVIRTNEEYQLINGNLKLGNLEESYSKDTGSLIVNGGLGVSGNIYTGAELIAEEMSASSDRRLKKDINILENSLDMLNKIEACSYKWKKKKNKIIRNKKINYGVIAQQLEKIGLEFMVKNNMKYKSVNYIQLIPLLISGIQELKNEVDVLKNEIVKLKN